MKVIAIDFDGCICKNEWPEIGSPNFPVIKQALEEQRHGAALILWTCREGEMLELALKACAEWGLKFDAVNANLPERIAMYNNDSRKIGADEYWDDHAVLKTFSVVSDSFTDDETTDYNLVVRHEWAGDDTKIGECHAYR